MTPKGKGKGREEEKERKRELPEYYSTPWISLGTYVTCIFFKVVPQLSNTISSKICSKPLFEGWERCYMLTLHTLPLTLKPWR